MPDAKKKFKSEIGAILGTASLLAVTALGLQQGVAFGRADTPSGRSAKTMTMKHAGYNVAKQAGGAGSIQGKPVVISGALLNGGHLNTAKWKGKVVVIDFWATWCPWCRAEMPSMEKLYQRYHSQGLEIVGVPLSDTAAAVRPYLKANPKVAWPEILDKGTGNTALAQKLGVTEFPAQCVIDRKGILRYVIVGRSSKQLGADGRKLAAEVRRLIQKADGGD